MKERAMDFAFLACMLLIVAGIDQLRRPGLLRHNELDCIRRAIRDFALPEDSEKHAGYDSIGLNRRCRYGV
jgi:hypothetical protein